MNQSVADRSSSSGLASARPMRDPPEPVDSNSWRIAGGRGRGAAVEEDEAGGRGALEALGLQRSAQKPPQSARQLEAAVAETGSTKETLAGRCTDATLDLFAETSRRCESDTSSTATLRSSRPSAARHLNPIAAAAAAAITPAAASELRIRMSIARNWQMRTNADTRRIMEDGFVLLQRNKGSDALPRQPPAAATARRVFDGQRDFGRRERSRRTLRVKESVLSREEIEQEKTGPGSAPLFCEW